MSKIPNKIQEQIDNKCQEFWLIDFQQFWDYTLSQKIYGGMIRVASDNFWINNIWNLGFIIANYSDKLFAVIDIRWLNMPKSWEELADLLDTDKIAEDQVITINPVDIATAEPISIIIPPKKSDYLWYMISPVREDLVVLFMTDKKLVNINAN